jgi:cyclohexadieny/prephenate dehydrogenase
VSKFRPFERIALIGIGLINSSIARLVRRDGLARSIAANARSQASLDTARRLGFVDTVSLDPAEAVKGADLVMIGTPLNAYGAIARRIGPALEPGAILTDVGSVKSAAVEMIGPHVPKKVHFVPGHPIAGTEHSGPEAGFAELFQGRWCVLTPPARTNPAAVKRVAAFWRAAGSRVEIMDPAHHDKVLAITSHLPHLIAYTIVGTVAELERDTRSEVIKFSASGFRDFTRIAASDPTMWRDIFLNNRDAVLEMLGRFSEDLTEMQRAVRRGDGAKLQEWFTRTRAIRRGIIVAKQV